MLQSNSGTKSVPNSLVKNRKMKLYFVLNTEDGIKKVGCRATGCYKGFVIEKTAWCNQDSYPTMHNELERLAIGRYNSEVRKIESLL